ncbi:MAG: hypothetical protein ACRDJX_00790 [Solirubrobacteraceae bacterium]
MFLDGDAFPIADPLPVLTAGLARAPLVAVRRAENLNDPQPHPCFCVTTVRTWRSLPGDWSLGPAWRSGAAESVSDVGANLLRTLELSQTPWLELLRTNGSKLHPVFFAIYADVVYHHGAGFRGDALSRVDLQQLKEETAEQESAPVVGQGLRAAVMRARRRGRMQRRAKRSQRIRAKASRSEHNKEQSRKIFEAIESNQADWLVRLKGAQEGAQPG